MRAAVFRDVGAPLSIEDVVLAPLGGAMVRVRLVASGVCHSDVSLWDGTIPQATRQSLAMRARVSSSKRAPTSPT